jgi:hypothetical protein
MLRDRYTPVDLFALAPALMLRFEPELADLDHLLEDDQLFQQVKADLARRRPHTVETGRGCLKRGPGEAVLPPTRRVPDPQTIGCALPDSPSHWRPECSPGRRRLRDVDIALSTAPGYLRARRPIRTMESLTVAKSWGLERFDDDELGCNSW